MNRNIVCTTGLLLVLMLHFPTESSCKEYLVFYLGGQSNMDGFGYNHELPDALNKVQSGIWIYHGNQGLDGQPVDGFGIWSKLRPGHGIGFTSDGKKNVYSNRFGVEVSLAATVADLFPDFGIAILKYSREGTAIDCRAADTWGCWDPDFKNGNAINQYDHFLSAVTHAMSADDIDGDGEDDVLIPAGIVWMQGESDAAHGEEIASNYAAHLKRLMDLVRAAFRTDDLPVVVGRISDSGQDDDGLVWDNGDVVRREQTAFVENDEAARLITTTDGYSYSDKWHYDGPGYIDLGRQFAQALAELSPYSNK